MNVMLTEEKRDYTLPEMANTERRTGQRVRIKVNRSYPLKIKRELAMEKLLFALETASGIDRAALSATPASAESKLARLSAARAAYALTSATDLQRVGNGAWLHRRHIGKTRGLVRKDSAR